MLKRNPFTAFSFFFSMQKFKTQNYKLVFVLYFGQFIELGKICIRFAKFFDFRGDIILPFTFDFSKLRKEKNYVCYC